MPPQGGRKHPHQELLQIDTTNILFICGGAFDGLEKIVEQRINAGSIGFNAEVVDRNEMNIDELLAKVAKGSDKVRPDPGVYRPGAGDGIFEAAHKGGYDPDPLRAQERIDQAVPEAV